MGSFRIRNDEPSSQSGQAFVNPATWPPSLVDAMRQMHLAGATPTQISDATGRTVRACRARARSSGFSIAEEPRDRWSPEQIDQLRELIAAGRSNAEIKEVTGRTTGAISGKVFRLGLMIRDGKSCGGRGKTRATRIRAQPMAARPPSLPPSPVIVPDAAPSHPADIPIRGCRGWLSLQGLDYCGAPKWRGSYCQEHWIIYHTPPEISQRARAASRGDARRYG